MILNIYPWQTSQWQQLTACHQQKRLPHALLFVGVAGLGKKHFADVLAQFLLCQKPADLACDECHSCQLSKAKAHPDFIVVEPLQPGHAIKVDQIRQVIPLIHETALQAGLRVVVISEAHMMNLAAANSLLKTLEEPPDHTIIILITDRYLQLPITILSRCQKIFFQKPSQQIALDWLKKTNSINQIDEEWKILLNMAQGAPLKTQTFIENHFLSLRQDFYDGLYLLLQNKMDPTQLATQYQDQDMMIFHLLLVWLQDVLRFSLTNGCAELINFDYHEKLSVLAKKLHRELLFDYFIHVKEIYSYRLKGLNLNKQLMLEELFIKWIKYATY